MPASTTKGSTASNTPADPDSDKRQSLVLDQVFETKQQRQVEEEDRDTAKKNRFRLKFWKRGDDDDDRPNLGDAAQDSTRLSFLRRRAGGGSTSYRPGAAHPLMASDDQASGEISAAAKFKGDHKKHKGE